MKIIAGFAVALALAGVLSAAPAQAHHNALARITD
jgi:hypothetical protein